MAAILQFLSGSDRGSSRTACTLDHLQNLCDRLRGYAKQAQPTEKQNAEMVEVIREITEALIHDEKSSEPILFDYFCEKNLLADFVQVFAQPQVSKDVKQQLLQTLAMLMQNLQRQTSLYYLFSNNQLNHLISTQFDSRSEDLFSPYASFLKSLAMRLDTDTIRFFYHEQRGQFPLYVEAVRFFAHPDLLAQTHVRNLTLQVFGIRDEVMQDFVLRFSWRTYFVHLACHWRDLWFKINNERKRCMGGSDSSVSRRLDGLIVEENELLMYVVDIFGATSQKMKEALTERLLQYAFFPVLLGSLYGGSEDELSTLSEPKPGQLSPELTMYLLQEVFQTPGLGVLLRPLAVALFYRRPPDEIVRACSNPAPRHPATYVPNAAEACGPPSAEVSNIEPLNDGAADDPGDRGFYCQLAERATSTTPPGYGMGADNAPRGQLLTRLKRPSDAFVMLLIGLLSNLRGPLLDKNKGDSSSSDLQNILDVEIIRSGASCLVAKDDDAYHDLWLAIVDCLGFHSTFRIVALQMMVRFAESLCPSLIACPSPNASQNVRDSAQSALRSAARHVRSYLQSPGPALELFEEEWLRHRRDKRTETARVCNSLVCLLPPSAAALFAAQRRETLGSKMEWLLPTSSEMQHAAKAIRGFYLLRGLMIGLDRSLALKSPGKSPPPKQLSSSSASPGSLQVDDILLEEDEDPGCNAENEAEDGGKRNSNATKTSNNANNKAKTEGEDQEQQQQQQQQKQNEEEEEDDKDDLDFEPSSPSRLSPLTLPGEAQQGYEEGKSFAMGRLDRLVCTVSGAQGTQLQYFFYNPYLLLLAQPDHKSPGSGCVRILAPLRCVEAALDSNQPQLLRLAIRVPKGEVAPSYAHLYRPTAEAEAYPFLPSSIDDLRGCSWYTLTLNFDDGARSRLADGHLRAKREEIRTTLRTKAMSFVERYCT